MPFPIFFDVLMEERGLLGGLVDLAIDLKRADNEMNLNTCVLSHCM